MITEKAIILILILSRFFSKHEYRRKETVMNDLPVALVRGLDELHREKELYGADQQATEIEGQGEGAQR